MKTSKEIYNEWLTKDGMGVRYTMEDRMLNAMTEFAEQQVKVFSYNLSVSGSATTQCSCGRTAHITKYCNVCDNDE